MPPDSVHPTLTEPLTPTERQPLPSGFQPAPPLPLHGKEIGREGPSKESLLRRSALLAKRIYRSMIRHRESEKPCRDYFSIAIYEGDSPFDLKPVTGLPNPVLRASDVTDITATYVADPFMVRTNAAWYLFCEILDHVSGKGVIGAAISKDGMRWDYRRVVLNEPFHLSYPYVFQYDGEWFLMPESHEDRSVRLYRAVEFPDRWEYVGNLLDGEFVDCSPFLHNGRWWLFAGCGNLPLRADTLRLFHADKLTGPWIEHPASPVVSGNPSIARPGGRVMAWNGHLLRFTQDCHPHYGLRIRAFEITKLTPEIYREVPVSDAPILQGSGSGWNASGMHHVDCHPLPNGRYRACVDGWYWGNRRL